MKLTKNKNKFLKNDSAKIQTNNRKLQRKVKKQEKKLKKAVHYANIKKTDKVCINSNDLNNFKLLSNNSQLCSHLKNKVLSNKANIDNKVLVTNKKVKKNKKISLKDKLNKSDCEENDNSFKISNKANKRIALLQEYVNKETQKVQNNKIENKNKENSNFSHKDKLITDKFYLQDLRVGQENDVKEFRMYARKLGMNAHQKKNIFPNLDLGLDDLLENIEIGRYEDTVNLDSNVTFENDLLTVLGKKNVQTNKTVTELKEVTPTNGTAKDMKNSLLNYKINNKGESQKRKIYDKNEHLYKGEEKCNSLEEGSETESEGSINEELSDCKEDNITGSNKNKLQDSNQGTNSESSSEYEESFNDREEGENESTDDDDNTNFLDDEAEEDNEYEEEEIDEAEELRFASGTTMVKSPKKLSEAVVQPTFNSLFSLYSSDSEDEDTDLDDFVVNDDFVEYDEDDDHNEIKCPIKKTKRRKKSRIIGREDVEFDSKEEQDCNKNICSSNFKRKRILSESTDNEEFNCLKKKYLDLNELAVKARENRNEIISNNPLECPKSNAKAQTLKNKKREKNCQSDDDTILNQQIQKQAINTGELSTLSPPSKNNLKIQFDDEKLGQLNNIMDQDDINKLEERKPLRTKKKKKNVNNQENEETLSEKYKDLNKDIEEKHKDVKLGLLNIVQKNNQCLEKKVVNGTGTNCATLKSCLKKADLNSNKEVKPPKRITFYKDKFYIDETKKEKYEKTQNINEKNETSDNLEDEVALAGKDITEEYHEDIYGRLRDKTGKIIDTKDSLKDGKYIPPAMRKLMTLNTSEKKKKELISLQRGLRGLLNKLAESNMSGIVRKIEALYQTKSKNDMNESLTKLFFNMLIMPTLTPEKIIQEHALIISILSANVGSEVGAYVLTEFVIRWVEEWEAFKPVANAGEIDSKSLDNLLLFIEQLYLFKVVDSALIYDLLHKIVEKQLIEKGIDLILLTLRTIGFNLRKDDPLALRRFILNVQEKVGRADTDQNFTRTRFMMEILTAIKNNNISKVPNYDPTHSQHLLKIMKGFINKGSSPPDLYVSLEDLLKSKIVGKWWAVGSAWSSGLKEETSQESSITKTEESSRTLLNSFSEAFLQKATKLHMSRFPRINILYAITEGSETYTDAFEKLIDLQLKSTQEKEIFNVMIYCCVRCKVYKSFYSLLAVKLCSCKKKLARLLQFSIWDTFQGLNNMKPTQVSNLAKFVAHLISEGILNLSVLQNLNFVEADDKTVSFLRQALITIMLHPTGTYAVTRAFNICSMPKFTLLAQYLKLFIVKFINPQEVKGKEIKILENRIKTVLDILNSSRSVKL